jgi:ion channel
MQKVLEKVLDPMRDSERGLPILLALLVITVFVMPTLGFEAKDERLYGDIVFSLLLMVGVVVASSERRVLVLVSVVSVIALAMRWATWYVSAYGFWISRELVMISTILMYCLVILDQVVRAGPITMARIQGAIVVYLMLGLGWADAYQIAYRIYPGSFTGLGSDALTQYEWVYYSFTTLTTVGYGDIVPVHRVARSLAIGEALTGQLYIAVLLARLVSLELIARDRTGK